MAERGVIYYATGETYVQQAKRSAQSLKEHNDVHVTVYSDRREIEEECIDRVVQIDPGEHPFYDRINYFKQAPYDRVLHLDTDTVVVGDIKPLFEMLERFDVVAAINESRDTASEHHKFDTVDIDAPDPFPEYQCGVIGFCTTDRVMDLFDDWQHRYADYLDDFVLDQPFFREALYNSDIHIGTLPSEYNALLNLGGYFEERVRIVHLAGKSRETLSWLSSEDTGVERLVGRLNKDVPAKRVLFYDSWNRLRVKHTTGNKNVAFRLLNSIDKNGIVHTAKRVSEVVRQKTKRR